MSALDPAVLANLGEQRILFLQALTGLAQQLGRRLFLIGGSVRDLLLQKPVSDLDLMLDGNLPEFIAACQSEWTRLFPNDPALTGVTRFDHYFTAKLRFDSPFRGSREIDLSQARAESYPLAGQKPAVQAGDLESDIRRRDFTVNSLALEFPDAGAVLVDLCRGQTDLDARMLRVHHDRSFVEDPIRLVRAVRFERRFQFQLESKTAELFASAVADSSIDTVPAGRRFDELKKVLSEAAPVEILERLGELGLVRALCPFVSTSNLPLLSSAGETWEERFRALTGSANREELERFLKSLQLSKAQRGIILQ